jgi:hypothetical protein
MSRESRIEAGRSRANAAKRAVALAAGGGFVALILLARHAHPGTGIAATKSSQLTPPSSLSSEVQQGLQLGGGSVSSTPSSGSSSSGSSSAAPQVQSSSS